MWEFMSAHPVATFFIILALGTWIPSIRLRWGKDYCSHCDHCKEKDADGIR